MKKNKSKNEKVTDVTGKYLVDSEILVEEILRPMERGQIILPAKILKN